jgi:hypothetical protein
MSDFQWCLICGRVTRKRSTSKEVDETCPTPGCAGTLGNIWDWDSFRQQREDLPVLPNEGQEYPL